MGRRLRTRPSGGEEHRSRTAGGAGVRWVGLDGGTVGQRGAAPPEAKVRSAARTTADTLWGNLDVPTDCMMQSPRGLGALWVREAAQRQCTLQSRGTQAARCCWRHATLNRAGSTPGSILQCSSSLWKPSCLWDLSPPPSVPLPAAAPPAHHTGYLKTCAQPFCLQCSASGKACPFTSFSPQLSHLLVLETRLSG